MLVQDIISELRAGLEQAKGMFSRISEDTGVDVSTISRIVRGDIENPRIETIDRLREWLADNPPPYVTVSASKVIRPANEGL